MIPFALYRERKREREGERERKTGRGRGRESRVVQRRMAGCFLVLPLFPPYLSSFNTRYTIGKIFVLRFLVRP